MIYSCKYSCRWYSSINSRYDICWYVGIGDCVCCGERRIGERRILGCTDYNGYVEILWFKTGVTVQFTEAIPEEVVNKFSEYISSEFIATFATFRRVNTEGFAVPSIRTPYLRIISISVKFPTVLR